MRRYGLSSNVADVVTISLLRRLVVCMTMMVMMITATGGFHPLMISVLIITGGDHCDQSSARPASNSRNRPAMAAMMLS